MKFITDRSIPFDYICKVEKKKKISAVFFNITAAGMGRWWGTVQRNKFNQNC